MLNNLKMRIIQEINKPIAESSDFSIALLITLTIFVMFGMMFGLLYLLDHYESFFMDK